MTGAQRDALLTRLDERTDEIKKALDRDFKVLYGNGKPGLLERVQRLEDRQTARRHHCGTVAAVLGFIVNAAIALYAAVKKSV